MKDNNETNMEKDMNSENENKNIGYVLGKAFAALCKVDDEKAVSGWSKTETRFFDKVIKSPESWMPVVVRHHFDKMQSLRDSARCEQIERRIAEAMDDITAFPKQLSAEEQGHFVFGYYQNR